MKAEIIRIGNSQGIRLPKTIIRQCGFQKEVQLKVEGNALVITPARAPRQGWEESFRAMAEAGDDAALWPEDLKHEWDETEWKW